MSKQIGELECIVSQMVCVHGNILCRLTLVLGYKRVIEKPGALCMAVGGTRVKVLGTWDLGFGIWEKGGGCHAVGMRAACVGEE